MAIVTICMVQSSSNGVHKLEAYDTGIDIGNEDVVMRKVGLTRAYGVL